MISPHEEVGERQLGGASCSTPKKTLDHGPVYKGNRLELRGDLQRIRRPFFPHLAGEDGFILEMLS